MVYNRTQTDVHEAKIAAQKIRKFESLTETEKQSIERGTMSIGAINRIESKQREIATQLLEMGYYGHNTLNKTWMLTDIFTAKDFNRIVDNNIVLRNAFHALAESPSNAVAKCHYAELNALEKILLDISQNIEYTISRYKICGTFNCGE